MKFLFVILAQLCLAQSFLIRDGSDWNDLKVTWGINPFGSNNFVSVPRTEQEAKNKGWKPQKGCSDGVNGNRYVLNSDLSTILIFNANGIIAGTY